MCVQSPWFQKVKLFPTKSTVPGGSGSSAGASVKVAAQEAKAKDMSATARDALAWREVT